MMVLISACASALGGGSGGDVEGPVLTPSSWKFRLLRGDVAADTGLSSTFSRNIATIDPTGVLCDATTSDISKARYDRPFRLSPVPVPEQVYAESVGIILASG